MAAYHVQGMNVRVSNHRRPNDEYEETIGSERLLKLYAIKHIEGFNRSWVI